MKIQTQDAAHFALYMWLYRSYLPELRRKAAREDAPPQVHEALADAQSAFAALRKRAAWSGDPVEDGIRWLLPQVRGTWVYWRYLFGDKPSPHELAMRDALFERGFLETDEVDDKLRVRVSKSVRDYRRQCTKIQKLVQASMDRVYGTKPAGGYVRTPVEAYGFNVGVHAPWHTPADERQRLLQARVNLSVAQSQFRAAQSQKTPKKKKKTKTKKTSTKKTSDA